MITQDELKKIVTYDRNTGVFRWKTRLPIDRFTKTWNAKHAGNIAGWRWRNKYVYLDIKNDRFQAHQLAWIYVYGKLPRPPLEIDHINNNGLDNRIENLRCATRQQQLFNTKLRSDNKTGHKGVFYSQRHKKWLVNIRVNGKTKHIGLFATLDSAVAARQQAAKKYHGEFAR